MYCITDTGHFHFPASCYTISLPSKVVSVCACEAVGLVSCLGTLNTCLSNWCTCLTYFSWHSARHCSSVIMIQSFCCHNSDRGWRERRGEGKGASEEAQRIGWGRMEEAFSPTSTISAYTANHKQTCERHVSVGRRSHGCMYVWTVAYWWRSTCVCQKESMCHLSYMHMYRSLPKNDICCICNLASKQHPDTVSSAGNRPIVILHLISVILHYRFLYIN